MTTQQTKVKRARQELMALSALIRRPPLDDVQLRMGVALTVADAIDTLFAQPEEPTPSPDLTARMVALVTKVAAYPTTTTNVDDWVREAAAIKADLEPVDGDRVSPELAEARELGARFAEAMGIDRLPGLYRTGKMDRNAVALREVVLELGMPR